MRFILEIDIPDLEYEYGFDVVLPEYLQQAASKVQHGWAEEGIIKDVNGNTIGKWTTEES